MLTPLPRLSYKLSAHRFQEHDRAATLTQSKIGGAPYRPKGSGWPCRANGEPYCFTAQLNLWDVEKDRQRLGLPPLLDGHLPTEGLLQFYLPFEDGWGLWPAPSESFVAYIPTIEDEHEDPLLVFMEHPRSGEKRVPEWLPEVQEIPKNPGREVKAHPGKTMWTFVLAPRKTEESILQYPQFPALLEPVDIEPHMQRPIPGWHVEAEGYEGSVPEDASSSFIGPARNQVGGYPYLIQEDRRTSDSPLRLLFQIDGYEETLWIGDGGMMYFFIDIDDLKKRDFSHVLMNWECH